MSPVGASDAAGASAAARRPPRRIPRAPFKVLDAPALQDDFYLNLVDWSAQNVLAVGLGSCVYLWSASTCKVRAGSSLSLSSRSCFLPLHAAEHGIQTHTPASACNSHRSQKCVTWRPRMWCAA